MHQRETTWLQRLTQRRYPAMICVGLLCALVLIAYSGALFRGLNTTEALYYAQLARNRAEGQGFVTWAIYPLSLTYHAAVKAHPELDKLPLFPLAEAMAFSVAVRNLQEAAPADLETIAGWTSALFFILTLFLLYRLGEAMYGPTAGLLSVALYTLNARHLTVAFSGLPGTLGACLMTLLLYQLYLRLAPRHRGRLSGGDDPEEGPLYMPPPDPAPRRFIVPGCVLGLLALTLPGGFWNALPLAGYLLFCGGSRRWKRVGVFVGAALVVMMPWFIRNASLVRSPFFSLNNAELMMDTAAYPGASLLRTVGAEPPAPWLFLVTHPREIVRKASLNLLALREQLPDLIDPYVAAFFFVGILHWFGDPSSRGLRYSVYLALALQILRTLLLRVEALPFLSFLPFIILCASALFIALLRDLQRYLARGPKLLRRTVPTFATLLLVGLGALPLARMFFGDRPPSPFHPFQEGLRETVQRMPEDSLILSDVPEITAWYGRRRALLIPQTEDDLARIETRIKTIQGVYLTRYVSAYTSKVPGIPWERMYTTPRPYADFLPWRVFANGAAILYVRETRASLLPSDRAKG